MPRFGSWTPDLPDYAPIDPQDPMVNLVTARNVFAGPMGYEPFRSMVAITQAATNGTWLGGGAFEQSDGTLHFVAGTTAGLEVYSSGSWSVKHSDTYTSKWSFVQFGDTVIGTADADMKPVAYDMAAGTAAELTTSPPNASMIAVVRDQVFLAGKSDTRSTVYWSAINDATGWTAGTNQSDSQLIPDSGPITGLAGGEFGLVFQQTAISIFEYVGTPAIYTRRKISDAIGALTHTGIAQAGSLVFFLSNRGFYMFNDGGLNPIGKDKVDRTFFSRYTMSEIQLYLRVQIEPNLNLVLWSMPGRLWIYNWGADKWSTVVDDSILAVTAGRTGYLTLDDLQALYGGTDSTPGGTDDPVWQGGDPMLLVVKSDNIHYAFGGTSLLAATLRGTKMELFPGNDTHAWNARISGSVASGATVTLDCAARLSDSQTSFASSDLRANGDYPLIARGRFIQPMIEITGDGAWDYIEGIDVEGRAGGRL